MVCIAPARVVTNAAISLPKDVEVPVDVCCGIKNVEAEFAYEVVASTVWVFAVVSRDNIDRFDDIGKVVDVVVDVVVNVVVDVIADVVVDVVVACVNAETSSFEGIKKTEMEQKIFLVLEFFHI